MRRWIEVVAKLYPAKWQQRYGTEFHALLADMEPSWRQFFDVLGGALKMQLLNDRPLYLKLGAAFAVLGMVIAATVSFVIPRQYMSSAVLRIAPKAGSRPQEIADQPLGSAIGVAYSRSSLSEIIQRPGLDLYRAERFREPLEDVIERMRHDLRVTATKTKDHGLTVRVEFLYEDPRKARQVVDLFLAKLGLSAQDMPVIEPTEQLAENRLRFVGSGLALGTLVGLLATFYVRQPRRAVLLTAASLAGCVLGAGLSFFISDRYISTAAVRIVPVSGQAAVDAAGQLQRAAEKIYNRTYLAELIQRPELNLYAKERSTTPLEDVIQKVQDHDLKLLLVSPGIRRDGKPATATAMEVRFEYPDRYKAQAMVAAVTRELAQSGPAGTVEYLDSASLPESTVFPNRYVISALGSAFGLLIGAVSIWAMSRRTAPPLIA